MGVRGGGPQGLTRDSKKKNRPIATPKRSKRNRGGSKGKAAEKGGGKKKVDQRSNRRG